MSLFHFKVSKLELTGHVDGDPHNGISQTNYLFTYGGTTTS